METDKASTSVPVLNEIWKEFATYDANAGRNQVLFKRLQNLILALGVIAVLLAVVQTQIFALVEPASGSANYFLYQALRWGVIIAPILIAALIALSNQFKSGNKWIMLRSGAESLKREIYRYRAQAGIYSDEATAEKSREEKLADKLTKIRRQVMKTSVSESSLKAYDGPIPPKMYGAAGQDDGLSFISSSQYIDIRLGDQRDYYTGKTGDLEKKLRFLQLLTVVIGGLGTLLAAVGFELWVALTTALVAAFVTYLEYSQTEKTLVIYNQVATDLKNVLTWWAALSANEQDEPANHNLLVQQTEQALEAENSGWVQNMTEALAELQEQHATMKDQVKADVQAVYDQASARQEALAEQEAAEQDIAEQDTAEQDNKAKPEGKAASFSGPIVDSLAKLKPPAPEPAAAEPAAPKPAPAPKPVSKKITEADYIEVANELGIELAAMKAVSEVEAQGSGFDKQGRPKILFEGHIFWRRLKARGIDPTPLVAGNENVLHRKWTKQYYREDQYTRLEKAKKINEDAALEAASWGMFQVLGQNWESLKYASAKEFVDLMYKSEGEHLKSFARFVKVNNLVRHLKALDWAKFAKGYNGPGYAANKYDVKMANKYAQYKSGVLKRGSSGTQVKALQKALGVGADGVFGRGTETALKKWQAANGLPATGVADSATLKKLLG